MELTAAQREALATSEYVAGWNDYLLAQGYRPPGIYGDPEHTAYGNGWHDAVTAHPIDRRV